MDWPSFAWGSFAALFIISVLGYGWYHLTSPADPRTKVGKFVSHPINEGTYHRSAKR